MGISRRTLLRATAAAALPATWPALAQQFPSKPIRIVLPASAGATIDVNGRYIAEQLGKRLNANIIVDNRAGVGGALGSDAVAKSPADGYTLLFAGTSHFTSRLLPDAAIQYDPVKQFTAIAKTSSAALALVVPANSPYHTLGDLIKAMKAKPGETSYATGGAGSTSHLCMVMFQDLAQVKARHIPYKGNTQAVTDTISGQVTLTWQGATGVLSLIKTGRLRALAVSSRARWETLPDVPTAHEAGVPGMDMASWMGLMGPAGLPQPVVELLSEETVRIAHTPEYKAFCDQAGMVVDIMDHRAFQADMPREEQKWKRIIALSNAQ